jgi:serine/threonine protein phosphatase PrpC
MSSTTVRLVNDQVLGFKQGIATTIKGIKEFNEDSVMVATRRASTRVCVADGHWGADAAHHSTQFWNELAVFPVDMNHSIVATRELEGTLFKAFGRAGMNEDKDQTPESAFVALELIGVDMRFVSYGDCRMMVIRDKRIIIRNEPQQTWIGAFSFLGLRKRLPIGKALEFQQHQLKRGDILLLFSDGIDECTYEVPTLTDEFFEQVVVAGDLREIHDTIMGAVLRHGAEDNASLVIVRV